MKRLIAIACVAMMSGCANIKDSADKTLDALTHPPMEFMDYLREVGQWLLGLLVGFLSALDPTSWF